ncbi:MAG: hypothetical protein C0501_25105 [Isosphaera sp.]|nr:hypothetical protein [Isosphaera sp.]
MLRALRPRRSAGAAVVCLLLACASREGGGAASASAAKEPPPPAEIPGKPIRRLPVRELPTPSGLSADGGLLAVREYQKVRGKFRYVVTVWDLKTGKEVRRVELEGEWSALGGDVALSPDGKWLAVAGGIVDQETGRGAGRIEVYEVATGEMKAGLGPAAGNVNTEYWTLAFVHGADAVVANCQTGDAVVWNWKPGSPPSPPNLRANPGLGSAGAVVPNGRGDRLVTHNSALTAVWDVKTGKVLKEVKELGNGRSATAVAWAPDDKTVVFVGSFGVFGNSGVVVLDVASGKAELVGVRHTLTSVAVLENKSAFGTSDGKVILWDGGDKEVEVKVHDGPVVVARLPGGRLRVYGVADQKELLVWEIDPKALPKK